METGQLVGRKVAVTFSDGETKSGTLLFDDGEQVDVEHSGWTGRYTRNGDSDTPSVVSVKIDYEAERVQIETLW